MTDRVGIRRLGPHRPLEHEPDGPAREVLLTQRHALTGKRILDRPLGPFGYLPTIPAGSGQSRRDSRYHARGAVRGHHALRAGFALRPVALVLWLGPLEPAACLGRDRHQRRAPDTRIHGVQKGGALAIEAIGHDILEREEPLMRHSL